MTILILPYQYLAGAIQSVTFAQELTPPEISFQRVGNRALVTITCSDLGSGILYGINGTPVTDLYSAPFYIEVTSTIVAIAAKAGMLNSQPTTSNYEFIISIPAIEPEDDNITNSTPVTITCEPNDAIIFYTIDGSVPTNIATDTNIQYFSPFTINTIGNVTIKAKAFKNGWTTLVDPASKDYIAGKTVIIRYDQDSVVNETQVNIGDHFNSGSVGFPDNPMYPIGNSAETNFLGIQFSIPSLAQGNTWLANDQDSTLNITDISISNVGSVYFLMNTRWGVADSELVSITFEGSNGALFTKTLKENYDIRNYNSSAYSSSPATININGTTTKNVWFRDWDGKLVLDMVRIDLPSRFASQELIRITVSDNGAESLQRVFIKGITTTTNAITTLYYQYVPQDASPKNVIVDLISTTNPQIVFQRIENRTLVVIMGTDLGASILYGINGAPVTSLYTEPFYIDVNSSISAIATKPGMQDSETITSSYEFLVAVPVITPSDENITDETLIGITCATSDAVIFYTTDGSTPNNTGTQYITPFTIDSIGSVTVKAKAFKSSWTTPAEPASIGYIVTKANPLFPFVYVASSVQAVQIVSSGTRVAAPIFTPYGGTITEPSVAVSITKEEGSTVYWTDNDSEVLSRASRQYVTQIFLDHSATLRAFATKEGMQDSTISQAQFVFLNSAVATLTPSLSEGMYQGSIVLYLTTTTTDAVIYYTTNGTIPDQAKTLYDPITGITIDQNTTIKAIAFKVGMIPSEVVTLNYQIVLEGQVIKPQIVPNGGHYISSVDVAINSLTFEAEIYYTTDLSIPSPSSPTSILYTQPVHVTSEQTIKAIAVRSGLDDSEIASAVFYIHQYTAPILQSVTNDDSSSIGKSVIITWDISYTYGVTGFKVKYGTEAGTYGYTYNVTDPGARTVIISGLTNGMHYYFSVVAMYGSDESTGSGEMSCLVRDVNAPLPPSDFSATITGNGLGILLRWKNPDIDFDRVVLVKNKTHTPASIGDGAIIYVGNDEEFIDTDI